jgi:hypothetical protein
MGLSGTAEAVPFQNRGQIEFFGGLSGMAEQGAERWLILS